jgi:hypothetical protein
MNFCVCGVFTVKKNLGKNLGFRNSAPHTSPTRAHGPPITVVEEAL